MIRLLALFAALSASATATGAQPREVQVSLPAADGFVIANRQRSGRQILVEMVPAGQSLTRYDRMIALQTFPGMGSAPAAVFLDQFARRYVAACPRARAIPVPLGEARGVRLECDRSPRTGKIETVFARAIPAGPDIALVHVTMTYFRLPRDAGWARDYLGKVALR